MAKKKGNCFKISTKTLGKKGLPYQLCSLRSSNQGAKKARNPCYVITKRPYCCTYSSHV